ncbi:hypothetical protein [Beduini massiliensis]|uniref:hypothetical protein n=1 Tax=Beduini massiliensis TaxID=1585974 RepID=UPI00059A8EE6|nr:hypothetical protein [Beduini massiliensis]
MEEDKKMKKVNIGYVLAYIFIPVLIVIACGAVAAAMDTTGSLAVVLLFVPIVLAVAWWSFGGNFFYDKKKEAFEKSLDAQGFVRNQTFNGGNCLVAVDIEHGKIAVLFRWNMFQPYIFSAKRIQKTWVDDGRGGAGFMEGSSRVSFLFTVDDIKIRVNTFTSNKRWRMDSNYILTGISKADMMVEILNSAKAKG